MIVANVRTTRARTTGVQRYVAELLSRLGTRIKRVEPSLSLHGLAGHAWEQFVLPRRLRGRLLWSPANTGPLGVERQVLTVHDLSAFECPEHLNPSFVAWYRWLLPRLVRRVRRVLVDSNFTRSRLLALTDVKPEKIAVVALGVDDRFHPCEEGEMARARAALRVPTRRYLLSLGSLEPRKNLPRLLRAWEHVQGRLPAEIWLVVAGSRGSGRVFRRQRMPALPARVHLSGYVDDALLPALYSGALAFVFPSEYEGFGLPPLEAMACGAPVICSNRASLPEVVGDAALLVEPDDLDSMSGAIQRAVEDAATRESLRARGLARVKAFTWERSADQTWAVLEDSAG